MNPLNYVDERWFVRTLAALSLVGSLYFAWHHLDPPLRPLDPAPPAPEEGPAGHGRVG